MQVLFSGLRGLLAVRHAQSKRNWNSTRTFEHASEAEAIQKKEKSV